MVLLWYSFYSFDLLLRVGESSMLVCLSTR